MARDHSERMTGALNPAQHNLGIASGDQGTENPLVVPETLHTFYRASGEVLGYLAIDSDVNGLSAGGIRMIAGTSVEELCYLARAMTLKFSFLNWPCGGAKAAIVIGRQDLSAQARRECLASFAERLAPFRGRYLPGEDAGTNTQDLDLILRTARMGRASPTLDSSFYTALTVRICAERLLAEQRRPPAGCTVAVEGFGKVGGWVARLFSEIGCRVVAVSTTSGAIHDPNGLDVQALLRARETFGDDCVLRHDRAQKIEPAQLLALPTDFLIPCALSWSIRSANADQVRAKAIVCGANNAVTEKAKETLAARAITYFPDFVSNSGGVLGTIIETVSMDRTRAVEILRRQFEPKLEDLFTRARSTGQLLDTVARDIAAANRQERTQRQTTAMSRWSSLAGLAYRQGLLPRRIVKLFAAGYVRRMMT